MHWLVKDGDLVNRAVYEFWGDTDDDILNIPKSELRPYSIGVAVNGGMIAKWFCDGSKTWYPMDCCGSSSGSGGNAGSGNTPEIKELREMIATLQKQLEALEVESVEFDLNHSVLDGNCDHYDNVEPSTK